jgi:hypothetical protein
MNIENKKLEKQNISIKETARIMGKSEQFVRIRTSKRHIAFWCSNENA